MSKSNPEDKHLPVRIAQVQMDIDNGINVEANEDLLESLLERQRDGNVGGQKKFTKIGKAQFERFNQ